MPPTDLSGGLREEEPVIVEELSSVGRRLRRHDRFSFSCYRGIACFNTCCRNKDLILTPYDVLRLKNRLGIDSDSFLVRYTLYRVDPGSGFPVLTLRLEAEPGRRCPFVTQEGCSVYEDRPMACRLFPLGRASGQDPEAVQQDEFFFELDAPGCLGLQEGKVWTVQEWVSAQGLARHTEMSDRMLGILFHPDRKRPRLLDDGQLQQIIVACYNLDVFREFVFSSEFLGSFRLDDETLSRIEEDDTELLHLGFAYLRETLFR